MIKYIQLSNFEDVENYLLRHQDGIYKTTRFEYYFKQVGDCAGIFRRGTVSSRGHAKGDEELIAYYHEGEI